MTDYQAEVIWERGAAAFTDQRYSRAHHWRFDGGLEIAASSSPHSVPLPLSDPAAIDPEEAYIAALSSCHMLWFLALAAQRGFCVDRYQDRAIGSMSRNATGKLWVSVVTLNPQVRFAGEPQPDREQLASLHESAHAECYIANSVRTQLRIEPLWDGPDPGR